MRRRVLLDKALLHGQLAHLGQSKLQRPTPRLLKGDAHLAGCGALRVQNEVRVLGGARGFDEKPLA